MLNKDIQQIKIDTMKVLLESCKANPNDMYQVAQTYLSVLQDSLLSREEFYKQQYVEDRN